MSLLGWSGYSTRMTCRLVVGVDLKQLLEILLAFLATDSRFERSVYFADLYTMHL